MYLLVDDLEMILSIIPRLHSSIGDAQNTDYVMLDSTVFAEELTTNSTV